MNHLAMNDNKQIIIAKLLLNKIDVIK